MMDDFRQDKQDQPLDPLSEDSSLPWGKKVGLVCLGVAVVGLFIFFTGDGWNSDSKKPQGLDELTHEVEQMKARLADLEQHSAGRPFASAEAPSVGDTAAMDASASDAPAMANLKSLIEQELQESGVATTEAPTAVAKTETAQKKPVAKAEAKQQTYTVKKGDTLSKIAQQFYGSSKKWHHIVDANKDKLGQSQVLRAGMTLIIPPKDA